MQSSTKQTTSTGQRIFSPRRNRRVASVALTLAVLGAVAAGLVWQPAPLASAAKATSPGNPSSPKQSSICPVGVNLIVNGDAETDATATGDGSANQDVSGWENETGAFTVVRYGAPSGFPTNTSPGPANRGTFFFDGGTSATSSGSQVIDLSGCSSQIDTGNQQFNLSGFLGGFQSQADSARVVLTFKDGANGLLGTASLGPVTAADRANVTGLIQRGSVGIVPAGTRTVEVLLQMTRVEGTNNDGYADNLSFMMSSATACSALPAGASSWWKAEGNAGDALGANNGLLRNGTTFTTGLVGQAFAFDGVDDDVLINRSIQDDFTIEFWLNTTQIVGTDGGQWWAGRGLVDGEVISVTNDFGVTLLNGKVLFGVGNPDVTIRSGLVADGNWHHVAATRLRSTGEIRLFIDGLQVAAATGGTQSLTAPPRLMIGRLQIDGNAFQGKLDEVAVYGRVLPPEEIAAIYDAGTAGKCVIPPTCAPPPPNMVAWWRAEGNANDSVGGHHGTLQNGAFAAGKVGQGFRLNQSDGTADQISIPDDAALKPQNFTVETWVRFDSLDSPGANPDGWQAVATKRNTHTDGFDGYVIRKIRSSGFDYFSAASAGQTSGVSLGGQTHIAPGLFYHVALTHDFNGTTGRLKLYVNGVLESSAPANFYPIYDTRPLLLGSAGDGPVNGLLNGLLDETSIYNRALTQAEIQSIFNAGSAGKCIPGAIQSLTFSPNPVNGGQDSTGTLTLTAAAPAGGTLVNLDSSNTSVAAVPASVTIAAGQTTGTFTATTSVPTSDATALITASSQTGSTSATLTVISPKPDLTVSTADVPPSTLTDAAFNVSWTVKNQGAARAEAGWTERVWLSNDNQLGANDTLVGEFPFNSSLEPNQSADRVQTVSIARNAVSQSGAYFLLIQTDANNQIAEGVNETNNFLARPINVTRQPRPDLVVDNISAPNSAFFGQTILVQWTVKNIGGGPTNAQGWRDFVYLSVDNVPEIEDPFKLALANVSYLAAGESYVATAEVKIPQGLVGQYKLVVWTDGDGTNHRSNSFPHQVVEDDDENNYGFARPIQLNTPLLPDLQVVSVVAPEEVFAGGQMTLNWRVENRGDGVTPPDQTSWTDRVYLSQDTTLDVNADRLVASRPRGGALTQNEGYTVSNFNTALPNDIAGDWYVFVLADGDNRVYEFNNENNNAGHDGQQPGSPMRIRATPPDLVIPNALTVPANGFSGQSVSVGWTVKNQGAFDAAPNWFDAIYLSSDQTLNTESDTLLTSVFRSAALGPGLTYDVSANVTLPPCISGTYYIFVLADSRRQIFEFDPSFNAEANNSSQPRPLQIADATPDLRVNAVSHPAAGNAGQLMSVSWTVANQGSGATAPTQWTDRIYLSPTQTFDSATALLVGSFDHTGALSNGASYTRTESIMLPNTAQGAYFVSVLTDANNEVEECANETNNRGFGPQSVAVSNSLPDLTVQSASSEVSSVGGQTVGVSWAVTNQGDVAANNASWGDAVYFSADAVLGEGDVRLASAPAAGPLAIGATYNRQTQLTLPVVPPGNYFLIVQADYLGNVFEGQREDNNLHSVALTVQAPAVDLTVTAVDAPPGAFSGQDMTVSWTVTNGGANPTVGSHWIDEVVLSLDQIDDPSDRVVGSKRRDGVLNGSASYSDSLSVFVPQGFTGQYYVFVRTDRRNEVAEWNESNNSAADGIVFDLTPPTDLVVSSVAPPSGGSPGEPFTVGWTVQNGGANAATGLWSDAVYLSTDQTWDIGDIPVGRQTQVGPVAPGQSYNGQLTTTLPALNPGPYYVIVKSDAQNRVRETDDTNNSGVASAQTLVDIQELQIGVPRNTTFITGQERFYRTNTPADETILFSVDGQPGSSNELFTRYGQIAGRIFFDFSFSNLNEPDQEVVIQSSQAGTYYNLVRGQFVPGEGSPENVTVKAEIVPFNIRQVSPSQAGNSGFTTLTIDGGKFQTGATVKLVDQVGSEIIPSLTKIDRSQIAALFDLRQRPTGTYDVVVTNPGGDARTLSDGFRIVAGGGHQVSVSVSSLGSVRPNTYGRFTVSVRNRGFNDALLTPLFIVLPANSEFRLSRDREINPLTQADLPPGINLEDVPLSIDTEDGRVIPLLVPLLRRGDTLDIAIDVLAPATEGSLSVRASLLPPMLSTDITTALSSSPGSAGNSPSQRLLLDSHTKYCLAEALRQTLFRVLSLALSAVLPTDCLAAIADQMLDALSIPSELILKKSTGEKAEASGWESIGSVVFSFLYKTAVCVVDLSPLKALKLVVKVMEAIKYTWDAYNIAKLADDCTKPPPKPAEYDSITTSSIQRPVDPNDKVGPAGFGEQQFVAKEQDLSYRINFENLPTATAYAQRVRITDQLDPSLDPRTVRLREIGFKQYRFQVPENRAFFQQRVQLGPDLDNVLADISAGVDLAMGTVTWTLTAIDPATGEQPNGASLGLLPPNNESNDGQGFVTFTVKPKSTAATGTLIRNGATITFDTEAPISTNAVSNTLDAEAPASAVASLPPTQPAPTFNVSWSGSDAPNGSGLLNYEVFVSANNGPYQPLVSGITATNTQFTGEPNTTYRFYSIARDNAGNVEAAPESPDALTTVGAPLLSPPTASTATGVTAVGFTANWGGSDGATGYRLDVSLDSSFGSYVGGYQDLDVGNVLTRSVNGLNPNTTYHYRLRAYNAVGASGHSNTISVTTASCAPRIDDVSPKAGRAAGGQQITLTGDFACLSTATIGGASVFWSYANGTNAITFPSPAHAVGSVDIVLTTASGGSFTRSTAFAYLPSVFTDDTLLAGITTAKAQHIIELRQAVDALRAVAGLQPAAWTDATLAPTSTVVKAVHIRELRTHLDDAATRLGYSTSPYTDPALTTDFIIKRVYIEELRQRIRAIAG